MHRPTRSSRPEKCKSTSATVGFQPFPAAGFAQRFWVKPVWKSNPPYGGYPTAGPRPAAGSALSTAELTTTGLSHPSPSRAGPGSSTNPISPTVASGPVPSPSLPGVSAAHPPAPPSPPRSSLLSAGQSSSAPLPPGTARPSSANKMEMPLPPTLTCPDTRATGALLPSNVLKLHWCSKPWQADFAEGSQASQQTARHASETRGSSESSLASKHFKGASASML